MNYVIIFVICVLPSSYVIVKEQSIEGMFMGSLVFSGAILLALLNRYKNKHFVKVIIKKLF